MFLQWHRIKAVMLRNILTERRSIMRLADFFYWPMLDITLWGLTSTWVQHTHAGNNLMTQTIMTGLVLWQVVMRAGYELSIGTIEELWSRSIINLFSTPLKVGEWVAALMLNGLLKSIAVLLFGAFLVKLLYGINIFSIGFIIVVLTMLLIMSGWAIGLCGAAMIIHWGQRVQSLPWIIAFLFAPFSAVFYPLSILPSWLQKACLMLPMTHVFEASRTIIATGTIPYHNILAALILNCCYLTGALILLLSLFEKSRAKGLSRLE